VKLAQMRRNQSTALDGIDCQLFFMKPGVKLERFFIKFVSKPSPKISVLGRLARLSVQLKIQYESLFTESSMFSEFSKKSNGA
jgi:hypothetical protein